jgi:hypothetical protein
LLGTDVGSFRYFFGYQYGASSIYYKLFDTDALDPSAPSLDKPSKSFWVNSSKSGELIRTVGSETLFLRLHQNDYLWMFDGSAWRRSEEPAKDVIGALTLPSGQPGIVGTKGRVASVVPAAQPDRLEFVEHVKTTGATPELFSVAPDSSAWGE